MQGRSKRCVGKGCDTAVEEFETGQGDHFHNGLSSFGGRRTRRMKKGSCFSSFLSCLGGG